MADRKQRPPAPLVEGQQYKWDNALGIYIGQTNEGEIVFWDSDNREWGPLIESPEYQDFVAADAPVPPGTPRRGKQLQTEYQFNPGGGDTVQRPQGVHPPPSGEPGSYVQGQPSWWDVQRDGKYPANWNVDLYGPYPQKVHYDDNKNLVPFKEKEEGFGADRFYAAQLKSEIDKAYPQQQSQGRIVSGPEVGGPEGSYFIVKPDGSLTPWKPEPQTQTGQLYPTYDAALKNVPPGYTPVQLSDGMWGFTAVEQQSLNERIDQLVLSKVPEDLDKAWALDNIRDQLNAPRGLTPDQAANLVMGLAVAPDEARSWIDMLTADWHAQRGLPPPVTTAPGQAPLQSGTSGSMVAPAPGTPFGPPPANLESEDAVRERNNAAAMGIGMENTPPWVLYGNAYKPEGPMPADQQGLYDAYRGIRPGETWDAWIKRTGTKDPFAPTGATATPSVSQTAAPTTTTSFASPQSTPIQVRQPFSTGPSMPNASPSSALWKSGNLAQYEQQLFGSKPLGLQDTFQQIWQRQWNQQQQRRFQAGRPQRTTFA